MKKVSLRDFQLKPSKYIDDLPITLTRYGKEIVVVKHWSPDGKTIVEDVPKEEYFNPVPKPKKK